jgi:outer membrane protein
MDLMRGMSDVVARLLVRGGWPLLLMWFPISILAQQTQQASPVTLMQAVQAGLERNPAHLLALADTRASLADLKLAKSSLLPHASFSEIATRGNDPVYVFGNELRQQRFTAADFTLNLLNTPLPLGNFASRFSGTWNLFDSFATLHGINRAERMRDAARGELDRTAQEIVFRVVDSYYHVLLAKKELEVAELAMTTAQAILDRSRNRFQTGVVVESDYLSAQVRLATRKQELIRAQSSLALARSQLHLATHLPSLGEVDAADTLVERSLPVLSLEEAEKRALAMRPDLKRLRAEQAAQEQSVSVARSSFGPRVDAFAAWELNNPTFLAGGGGSNWLAGIEVRFDLFEGGGRRAQLSHEQAMQEKAAAASEMSSDEARLEVRRAYYDLDSTRQQIEVARASVAEARQGLEINQNRYDSGLSTITDLLVAEDAARSSQVNYWEALFHYYVGYASLELADGTLNAQSPVVTP